MWQNEEKFNLRLKRERLINIHCQEFSNSSTKKNLLVFSVQYINLLVLV